MDTVIRNVVSRLRVRARDQRARLFLQRITLEPQMRVLDLGSGDGSHVSSLLAGSPIHSESIFIADIDRAAVQRGYHKFGFTPVFLEESAPRLPFPDNYFDVVFCSSVIEHVTLPKKEVWSIRSSSEFQRRAWRRQREFAGEVQRISKQFFVQTPNRYFPIESHTWLPFIAWLPRPWLLSTLSLTNRIWIKKTGADWCLLDKRQLAELFPAATILEEKFFGFTKSVIAIQGFDSHVTKTRGC